MKNDQIYLFHSCDYLVVDDKPIIKVRLRGEDGSDVIFTDPSTRPYFYVKRSEVDRLERTGLMDRVLRIEDVDLPGTDGELLTKITVKIPKDVSKLRLARDADGRIFSKTYESRILFPYVYLIDKKIYAYCKIENDQLIPIPEDPKRQVKLRKFAIDIEVGEGKMEIDDPQAPLAIIGLHDNYDDKYYQWYYYPKLYAEKGIHFVKLEGKEKYPLKKSRKEKNKRLADVPEYLEYVCWYFDDEVEMVNHFLDWWKKNTPDIIHAWNGYGGIRKTATTKTFRPGFDFPYMIARMKEIGVDPGRLSPMGSAYVRPDGKKAVIKLIQIYDAMYGYDYWQRKRLTLGLHDTGKRELGFGKIKLDAPIASLVFEKPKVSRLYNLRDVVLEYLIDKAIEMVDRSHRTVMLVGAMLQDSQQNSRIHTVSTLRKARGYIICETKEHSKYEKFKGGRVIQPKPGIYNGYFAKIDLSRAYPSAQIDLNMSPETKYRGNNLVKLFDIATGKICRAPTGVCFWKSPIGLAPRVYKDFLELRNKYKKIRNEVLKRVGDKSHPEYVFWYNKEYSVKPVTNSYYGVLGMPGFMLYDRDVARSVTATVRYVIGFIMDILEEQGVEIIAGDTDSVMFRCPYDDLQSAFLFAHAATQYVNEKLKELKDHFGVEKINTSIGIEDISKSFIVPINKKDKKKGRKKAYSRWTIYENGVMVDYCPDVVGFETVKGNTPQFSKDLQKIILKKIHKGAGRKEIIEIIKRSHEILRNAPPDYIGIKVTLNKNFYEYKGEPQPIRGMKYGMRHLGQEWKILDHGYMVFTEENKNGEYPPTDVLVLKKNKLPKGFKIDVDRTFERIAWGMVEGIVSLLGIERTEILYKNAFSQGYDNAFIL
ncbi:MAG: DNA polymerase domain-containing protein [Candidatus Helarchaeales archaeon]